MFEHHKIAERLREHAEPYVIAAALYSDEKVSAGFEQLAEICRQVAQTVCRGQPEALVHQETSINSGGLHI